MDPVEAYYFQRGYTSIGGIDEAGRGPLAGPVVAACVVCPREFDFDDPCLKLIKDSKKISARQRDRAYNLIYEIFPEVGIGYCDNVTIDRINILEASFLAMKKAIGSLKKKPDFILLDGKLAIPNLSLPQTSIVNGDNLVLCIAAASIIAKVTRDRLMVELDSRYPEYGFKQHKGYGTKLHLAKLSALGPSPIHRRSFAPVRNLLR